MDAIRRYAEAGYDYHALTATEQDALRDAARRVAAIERQRATRALFGAALARLVAVVPHGRRARAPMEMGF